MPSPSHIAITLIYAYVSVHRVYTGGSIDNNVLVIVVLSTLSALLVIIVSVIICCLCMLRRRRQSASQRSINVSSVVAGLDNDPAIGRLSSVRRTSSQAAQPRPLRWFPAYGPARSGAYLPAAWQQTASRPDVYESGDWMSYNDDLSQMASVNKLILLLIQLHDYEALHCICPSVCLLRFTR